MAPPLNARPLPPPPGWCERCDADVSDDRTHYHCAVCGRRTSMMGHLNGCPTYQSDPPRPRFEDTSMIDTRVQSVTTTVVRRSMKTPTHWNEVMKVTTLVMHELNAKRGRAKDATPFDNEMWFEPGPDDGEISICYQLSQTHDEEG